MNAAPIVAVREEQAVLGAILLAGAQILEPLLAETGLRPGHFYRDDHRETFEAMVRLLERGAGIDLLTVTGELRATGRLAAAGDEVAIEALAAAPPVTGHATTYAAEVIAAARWRDRRKSAIELQAAVDRRDDAAYFAALTPPDEPDRSDQYGPDALAIRFEQLLDADPTDGLVPTPWPAVNDALHGGARRGDTTIVAGWTSMGKSVASLDWLDHIGQQGGHVGLYTNEMAVDDVTARLVAAISGVPFWRIMRRDLTPQQRDLIRGSYPKLKVTMIGAFGWPWQDIARHIRRQRWDLCCLDLFNGLPGLEHTSDIDTAIRGLVNAAAQAETHLIVVSQLNQERSKGSIRPMPTSRDLRGSGAMANDPANIVFVHRDQDLDDEDRAIRLETGVMVLDKARNGRPGAVQRVTLDAHRMRFEHGEAWRGRDLEAVA